MSFSYRYNKPARRPEPPSIEPITVTDVQTDTKKDADKQDLLWGLGRLHREENKDQMLPAWTGFNTVLSQRNLPTATIRYMAILRAPPSDQSTIYTILKNLVQVSEKLGQHHILVTADMAIYSKAQQILWSKPSVLDGKVTMRLGGMHTTMALLAAIGKLYGDGGLLSLMVESNIFAEATARQMLQGNQVARGIRGIKIIYEALLRAFYESFKAWLTDTK